MTCMHAVQVTVKISLLLLLTLRRRSAACSCASRQPPSAHRMGSSARCLSRFQASSKASPIHACPPECKTRSILPPGGACTRGIDIRSWRTRQSDGSPAARRSGRSPLNTTICKCGSKHAAGVRNLLSPERVGGRRVAKTGVSTLSVLNALLS